MNILKYLFGAVALVAMVGCAPEEEVNDYPNITDLTNSVWESRTEDKSGNIYYHVMNFAAEGKGSLTNYDTDNLQLPLSTHTFTYTFPLNERWGITLRFDEETSESISQDDLAGKRYDGYLIQKGNIKVDFKDVYVIQLFEVDNDGNQILNDKGEPVSTMTFWKE